MKLFSRAFSILLVLVLGIAALPTGNAFAALDTQGPVTSLVAFAPTSPAVSTMVTVTATVDDTTTGGSTIQSAEFSVNGGAFSPMTASDGAFDEVSEDVTGTFPVTLQGKNTVCVQGTDSANNVGAPVCADFTTQSIYTFTGFLPPLRKTIKFIKAGRVIPVKWNLKLAADGTPVSDPAAIVGVESYSVDCTTMTGDPTTAVIEKGPGKTHLRAQHAGKWIFNWKTPKAYKGTCRVMFVMFGDGTMSPTVFINFK